MNNTSLGKSVVSYIVKVSIAVLGLSIFHFVIKPAHEYLRSNKVVSEKLEKVANKNQADPFKNINHIEKNDSSIINTETSIGNSKNIVESTNQEKPVVSIKADENIKFNFKRTFNIPGAKFETKRGFFSGIWHAIIIGPTFIFSWFTEVRVYADFNSGFFYWVGYVLGILILLVNGK